MKPSKKLIITAFAVAALIAAAWAENPPSGAPAAKDGATAPAPPAVTAADIQALKDALAAQQLQINRLTEQLERQQAQQAAAEAAGKSNTRLAPQQEAAVAAIVSDAALQQGNVPPTAQNPQDSGTRPGPSPIEGPLTIRFRGISITPGGYAAAEFVRRSRALGADVVHPLQLPDDAWRLAEFGSGIFRVRPPIENHSFRQWSGGKSRSFQLRLG